MTEPTHLTQPIREYEFHPLADMFPLIEGEDFDQLVEDIGNRGILSPIILYEGKILDGRNRYRAAKEAGHKFTDRQAGTSGRPPDFWPPPGSSHRRTLRSVWLRRYREQVAGVILEAAWTVR